MKTDNATWKQWVDLELEGELEAPEKARLDELVATDDQARNERRTLASLHRILEEDRVAVRPAFTAQVMDALPRAWWERTPASAGLPKWALPLAMMLVATLGAALLLVGAEGSGRITAIGGTLLDFTQVTVLAGAGMLFATWRGVGFGLQEMFAGSSLGLAVFAVAIVCLNLLFVSMLRRRPRAVTASVESKQASD